KLLLDFLTEESALSAVWTEWGTTSFVQALDRNADDFLRKLRAEHDTSAVPGRFFEMPDHFRIGMGVNTEMFAEGLKRIRRAISQGQWANTARRISTKLMRHRWWSWCWPRWQCGSGF